MCNTGPHAGGPQAKWGDRPVLVRSRWSLTNMRARRANVTGLDSDGLRGFDPVVGNRDSPLYAYQAISIAENVRVHRSSPFRPLDPSNRLWLPIALPLERQSRYRSLEGRYAQSASPLAGQPASILDTTPQVFAGSPGLAPGNFRFAATARSPGNQETAPGIPAPGSTHPPSAAGRS